ncbi:Rieske (2Fe-2S) protein [Pseudonocardia spirodelae]|uniref:Cytochrome bc1 complex Rieske iron-sulfur subunit n=1 Tax=Pseudonocardia spirodelae TaxID=3133431 RepID=A0ABU8T4I6_9PSEU
MSPLTRRRLLAGAGAAAACCAAGCATYGTPREQPAPAPAAPTGAAPASAPTAAPPSTATPPAGLAATGDIPVGSGRVFAAEKVVVTQPTAGTFVAFDAVCTHAGCLVDQVSDAGIACPCHGSVFDTTDGAPLDGPATAPLAQRAVRVEGDRVVLG